MSRPAPAQPRCKLSILLVTYNHEAYIGRALQGLLDQRHTLGEIQVVVADDGSQDATPEIIRRMLGGASMLSVHYLPADANVGIVRNYQRGFAACSGEYVAVLEGDDYWIRRTKLQDQVDFLEEYSGLPACGANYFVKSEEESRFQLRVPEDSGHRYLDARALISDNIPGNFSNMVYRTAALRGLPPEMYELRAYDWLTNILLAQEAPIGFLHQPAGVYRVHACGAWSGLEAGAKLQQQISDIDVYDAFTGGRFHSEFLAMRQALEGRRDSAGQAGLAARLRRMPGSLFLPPVLVPVLKAVVPPVVWIALAKLRKVRN